MVKACILASRRPFSSTASLYCSRASAKSCSSCCRLISRRDNCKGHTYRLYTKQSTNQWTIIAELPPFDKEKARGVGWGVGGGWRWGGGVESLLKLKYNKVYPIPALSPNCCCCISKLYRPCNSLHAGTHRWTQILCIVMKTTEASNFCLVFFFFFFLGGGGGVFFTGVVSVCWRWHLDISPASTAMLYACAKITVFGLVKTWLKIGSQVTFPSFILFMGIIQTPIITTETGKSGHSLLKSVKFSGIQKDWQLWTMHGWHLSLPKPTSTAW